MVRFAGLFEGRGGGVYRAEDNLGVFDAHEKNLVRAGELLVPFDVIPCHPGGGFLDFIRETLDAGHTLKTVRSVSGESSGKGSAP